MLLEIVNRDRYVSEASSIEPVVVPLRSNLRFVSQLRTMNQGAVKDILILAESRRYARNYGIRPDLAKLMLARSRL
jgi:hypothetical protein